MPIRRKGQPRQIICGFVEIEEKIIYLRAHSKTVVDRGVMDCLVEYVRGKMEDTREYFLSIEEENLEIEDGVIDQQWSYVGIVQNDTSRPSPDIFGSGLTTKVLSINNKYVDSGLQSIYEESIYKFLRAFCQKGIKGIYLFDSSEDGTEQYNLDLN